MAQLDALSDWRPGGRGFCPRRGQQHSFVEIDHEIKRWSRDREVPGSIPTNCKCCFLEQETLSTLLKEIPTNCKCCFLEQETLSTLLSTGFYPGKKRATWKISTRLLNMLPSINKVDYYYYYY